MAVEGILASSLSRLMVKGLYERTLHEDEFAFPISIVQSVGFASLRLANEAEISTSENDKTSIHIVLRHVVLMLKKKVLLLTRTTPLSSNVVLASGVANFTVRQGFHRKLATAVSNEGNFFRGQPKGLVLMELALAENERYRVDNDYVYGVVRNYRHWYWHKRVGNELIWFRDII